MSNGDRARANGVGVPTRLGHEQGNLIELLIDADLRTFDGAARKICKDTLVSDIRPGY